MRILVTLSLQFVEGFTNDDHITVTPRLPPAVTEYLSTTEAEKQTPLVLMNLKMIL